MIPNKNSNFLGIIPVCHTCTDISPDFYLTPDFLRRFFVGECLKHVSETARIFSLGFERVTVWYGKWSTLAQLLPRALIEQIVVDNN